MAQELKAITGIRSMLAARANVERVLYDDVSWLLPGRQLASIDTKLGAAAADALAGAEAIGETVPNVSDRLKHAAALLSDTPLTTDRATWNSGRSSLSEARDAINDAIVGARESLQNERNAAAPDHAVLFSNFRGNASFQPTAEHWTTLADFSELPFGIRPQELEHVSPRDVKLMREQATRLTEGLPSSQDPRLDEITRAISITETASTREATEALLEATSASVLGRLGNESDRPSMADDLHTIAALQRLDGTLRPRALERTGDVPWSEASSLLARGANVPPQWDGFQHLRTFSELGHPQASLEELLQRQPHTWSSGDWRRLGAMIRIAPEERPVTLGSFSRRDARQAETVAGMLDKGQGIPASWNGFGKVNSLRASALWASQSTATEHLQSIVRAHPNDVTKAQIADLDALRQLPDGIRPNGISKTDDSWAQLALSDKAINDPDNATHLDAFTRLSLQLKSKDELRATLSRIDEDVLELTNVQAQFGHDAQVPRSILQRFGADLRLLRGFQDLPGGSLLDDTEQLVRHNIGRLDGKVAGGYGRHVEYADLGRIRENVRLLTELAREQALGESDTAARARAAAAAAAPSPEVPAADAAGDAAVISW